jgi:hypothetical protein
MLCMMALFAPGFLLLFYFEELPSNSKLAHVHSVLVAVNHLPPDSPLFGHHIASIFRVPDIARWAQLPISSGKG